MTGRGGRGHALYVAWGFPPAKSGGVFRMMETANVLVEEGWDVTVLACDVDDLRRYAGVDLSTLAGVDDRVRVVRVPMQLGPFETDLHRWDERRVDDPDGWFADYQRQVDAGFPNSVYSLWERPLLAAAHAVHAEHAVDLVIASGGPFVCFAAGLALREAHGIPYVVDYRDSWSLQQFTDERLHGPGSAVERVESRLLAGALEAWFVNRPMLEWHEEVYPHLVGKTRVVTNGHDPAALAGLTDPTAPADGVRFGYVGTLTTAVPLQECLQGWALARRRDPLVAAATFDVHGYLGFYPTPHAELRRRLEAAAGEAVRWRGAVPKDEVGRVYADLDALVLAFGGSRYVTSGKVFEYMATARPVVSVHHPDNAVKDVLEGYPLWFRSASLDPDDVAAAFAAAAAAVAGGEARRPEVLAAARAHAEVYERRARLRPAVRAVGDLLGTVARVPMPRATDAGLLALLGRADTEPVLARVAAAAHRCGWRTVAVDPVAPAGSDRAHAGDDDAWLEQRVREVHLAEPGTVDGRLRRLYAAVLDDPAPAPATLRRDVLRAERLVATGAGAFWSTDPTDARALAWAASAVPGARACLDLRRHRGAVPVVGDERSAPPVVVLAEAPDDVAGPPDDAAEEARTAAALEQVLGPCTARRARRPQERPAVHVTGSAVPEPVPGGAQVAGAAGPRTHGGRVVLTSLPVQDGAPALELARSLLADGGDVVVLARAVGARRSSTGRRTDSWLDGVGVIRLPLPVRTTGDDVAAWRQREGAWRDRRVTVQAPLSLRVRHVQHSKRLRARAARTGSVTDKALVAASRGVSAGFKVLGVADRAVDLAERRIDNGVDRLAEARGVIARWEDLHPEAVLVSDTYGPVLDNLRWDTLHVVDPGAVAAATDAVARRRAAGLPASVVLHLSSSHTGAGGADPIPYREQAAYRRLAEVPDTVVGDPVPPARVVAEPRPERPWTRTHLRSQVGFGAYNMAGQTWEWAKALEATVPGVATEVLTIDRGSHLMYPSDVVVPIETFTDDHEWAERFEAHVVGTWTHAVIEGGRAILGRRYGRTFLNNVPVLKEAGIEVGLVFHGSDLRDPRRHATRSRWSPFQDPDHEVVAVLQARRGTLYPHFLEFDGPKWVSTPDLLLDLPGATWLPVVVDPARWRGGREPLRRKVPRVVHAPSRTWLKGTAPLEEALAGLRSEGLIDYRRIEKVPPEQMPQVLGDADIVLDQFALGSYGVAAVEAMAAGRLVVGHVVEEVRERCPAELPVVEATPDTVDAVLRGLLADLDRARELARRGPEYVREVHDGRLSGRLLAEGLRVRGEGAPRGRLGPPRHLG